MRAYNRRQRAFVDALRPLFKDNIRQEDTHVETAISLGSQMADDYSPEDIKNVLRQHPIIVEFDVRNFFDHVSFRFYFDPTYGESRMSNDCAVCGKPDHEKPMAFRGEDYCCDLHRKVLAGELKTKTIEVVEVPATNEKPVVE